ncbi:hypothetical protein A2755_00755 [Candidatus Wolfebacteria bacterium RIFCSPHIGHO2_01_FULL_48_22]|uniref:Tagatose-bisphosphate aldolase n=2 Tax=Candidatus Wolfeibacteriota TaxID=1752735 RepID=A0A1F8DTD4_9BACT|nr:MAG: hypothetical protein A2755_00755 [Candidatus Wolfebacteria bacterium RIFCSPHIGHO2_01_FULL_48_22]OGM93545.1 MAG: hypothetical protein A2935_02865 [Candidatus Wolfebacteria bacterium RIFCSPLOWO2_01_FULL_47_17b]
MKTLREYLREAKKNHHAVGHFNVSDLVALRAIGAVAAEKNTPIIIGTSEGEREFLGVNEIAALIRAMREKRGIPVFLNADHTKSFEKIKEAVEAGYDAVLFDRGAAPLDENIEKTKEVVSWVRAYNEKHSTDILVEGELGYIGTSSVMLDELPVGAAVDAAQLTTVADVTRFVDETGVDLIAPAVGNIHGMLKGGNPHLDTHRIKELVGATEAGVVLHGASGLSDEQVRISVEAGVRIVHVNTELRAAWRHGFDLALVSHPNELVPYKILPEAVEEVKKVVERKVKLFYGG